MNRLHSLPDRALQLADQVGDGFRHAMPAGAEQWLKTGVAIGALKQGSRVAGGFVRRNPAAVAAAAAGVGVLWLLARRRAQRAENGEAGTSTRIQARRSQSKNGGSPARKPRASKRTKAAE